MIRRNIFAAAFVACLCATGSTGTISSANAAVIGPVSSGIAIDIAEQTNPKVTEVRKRRYSRGRRRGGAAVGAFALGLFLGHAARSEPYYYYKRSPRRSYRSSCSYWSDRCADNWGYRNSDYYGCLRYHGC
jgi:hypothetical protein